MCTCIQPGTFRIISSTLFVRGLLNSINTSQHKKSIKIVVRDIHQVAGFCACSYRLHLPQKLSCTKRQYLLTEVELSLRGSESRNDET